MLQTVNLLEILAILAAASQRDATFLASLPSPLSSLLRALPAAATTYLARVGQHIALSSPFLASFAIAASGTLLRYAAIRWLGRLFTYQLAVRKGHELVTSGPYRLVRHPSYLGAHLFMVGTVVASLSPGSFWRAVRKLGGTSRVVADMTALTCVVGIGYMFASVFIRAPREDKVLKAEFGEQWEEWAKQELVERPTSEIVFSDAFLTKTANGVSDNAGTCSMCKDNIDSDYVQAFLQKMKDRIDSLQYII